MSDAFMDAAHIVKIEPKNKTANQAARRVRSLPPFVPFPRSTCGPFRACQDDRVPSRGHEYLARGHRARLYCVFLAQGTHPVLGPRVKVQCLVQAGQALCAAQGQLPVLGHLSTHQYLVQARPGLPLVLGHRASF